MTSKEQALQNIDTEREYSGGDTVHNQIKKSLNKGRPTASAEQAEQAQKTMKTQGVKGAKMQRINLCLTPENYQYIQVLSKATGAPATHVINDIISRDADKNKNALQDIQDALKKIR